MALLYYYITLNEKFGWKNSVNSWHIPHAIHLALVQQKAGDSSIYNTACRNRSCASMPSGTTSPLRAVSEAHRMYAPSSMNIYCCISVSIVAHSAWGTIPFSEFQILHFGIFIPAYVAQLARRIPFHLSMNTICVPNFIASHSSIFKNSEKPKLWTLRPPSASHSLNVKCLNAYTRVLFTQFTSSFEVEISALVNPFSCTL